ncbi:MAG TPA: biopolymer transporter ExbB [Microscillaceae bacterium]|nr:biopolymer transporter ExbB [Microscillaceae bacterium]
MVLNTILLFADKTPEKSISVLELIFQAGVWMYPMFILSVIALYIFIERLVVIRSAMRNPASFMKAIKKKVMEGDIEGARVICRRKKTPIARMIEKGLSRVGSSLKNIETSIEYVGKIELYRLEKNLAMLATIAGAAPMVGFLGTVVGMISAFIRISQQSTVSPQTLSEGIYTALLTTAGGLIVGILANVSYNYLMTRVQKVVHQMEYVSMDFMDLLQEPS